MPLVVLHHSFKKRDMYLVIGVNNRILGDKDQLEAQRIIFK